MFRIDWWFFYMHKLKYICFLYIPKKLILQKNHYNYSNHHKYILLHAPQTEEEYPMCS